MTLAFITFDLDGWVFFSLSFGCLLLLILGLEISAKITKLGNSAFAGHAEDRRALARSALLCSYILSLVVFAPSALLQVLAIVEYAEESGQSNYDGPRPRRISKTVIGVVLTTCFYPVFFYVGLTSGWKDAVTEDDG